MAKSIYTLLGINPPSTVVRYTTSWILPPIVLAFLRLLISLYVFVTLFVVLGTDTLLVRQQHLSYFTNLTYWGIAFYFLVSGIHTLSYARTGTSYLQRFPRPLQALHAVYYTTIVTYPFLVTIVFWAILYTPPWFHTLQAWSNISQHALNSFFALLEIILTTTLPLPPFHILPLLIILALYLGLAYLTHHLQGFYPYSFLNPANGKGKTAGYIIGIAVGAVVIWGIVWLLIWVRGRLTGGRVKFSKRDGVNVGEKFSGVQKGRVEEVEMGGIEK